MIGGLSYHQQGIQCWKHNKRPGPRELRGKCHSFKNHSGKVPKEDVDQSQTSQRQLYYLCFFSFSFLFWGLLQYLCSIKLAFSCFSQYERIFASERVAVWFVVVIWKRNFQWEKNVCECREVAILSGIGIWSTNYDHLPSSESKIDMKSMVLRSPFYLGQSTILLHLDKTTNFQVGVRFSCDPMCNNWQWIGNTSLGKIVLCS